jgi:plasmid rolling circle replication initiator protein Rep
VEIKVNKYEVNIMELRRILTITYDEANEPYQNHITCPYCGEGKIEFQEDNYPKGEDKKCLHLF